MSEYYFIVCERCKVYGPSVAVSTGRHWVEGPSVGEAPEFIARHGAHEALTVKSEEAAGFVYLDGPERA